MSAWFEDWFGLALRTPAFLWLLLAIPTVWLWRRRLGRPAVSFAPHEFARDLPPTWRTRLAAVPFTLESLGLALVVVALARPIERVPLPAADSGIDVVLCLDVSSSMAATDMDPARTRLDVSTAAARKFVAARPHDRIGLVRFARFPDVLCPPTLDHRALVTILDGVALVAHDGPEDLTGIGTAVARAAGILRHSDAKSKVIVLLTDGEENVATADTPDAIGPVKAARLCTEFGVRVYAIAAGIGTRGVGDAWRPIDTGQIGELARATGGRLFEARDATAMDAVYASIDVLEKVGFEEPRYAVEERFLGCLLAALALLVLGRGLEGTVQGVLP